MTPENKLYTFAVIAGTRACDARCPCCISKMTPPRNMSLQEEPINWGRFADAFRYAASWKGETEMFTGKGETLLYPHQISQYLIETKKLEERSGFRFKTKEMQTNGIKIQEKPVVFDPILEEWRATGLETISISIVHYEEEPNRTFFLPYKKSYIDLGGLIRRIHDHALQVRLSCIFTKGNIDSPEKVIELIEYAKRHQVDELTIRSVSRPDKTENEKVYQWVVKNEISPTAKDQINEIMWKIGKPITHFPWGAVVFDVDGQNVCLTNCLTPDDTEGTHRQLIFFPNGTITTGWTDDAEILP